MHLELEKRPEVRHIYNEHGQDQLECPTSKEVKVAEV